MADFYRDCWIHAGQVRTVERTTETGMHVRGWGDNSLVWRGHHDDLAYLNGEPLSTERVKGNWPCAFTPDGRIAVQHGEDEILLYDPSTRRLSGLMGGYAAEGIIRVDMDEFNEGHVLVMGNDPSLRRAINGETWFNCVETENYIVGQFGRDPDYGGALSKLDKRTGQVTRWLGYTPHPPRAVELDGVLTVAISGRDTPAPDQVEWVANFPPLSTHDPKPVDPPKPPDTDAAYRAGWAAGVKAGEAAGREAWRALGRATIAAQLEEITRLRALVPTEPVYTAAELLRLVNDATGQMAGYWRYLGVQGAVDRAVKAELSKRA
jgi:hypothetical protein